MSDLARDLRVTADRIDFIHAVSAQLVEYSMMLLEVDAGIDAAAIMVTAAADLARMVDRMTADR